MKCLQCGTELDRLSKWRRSSGYCSEECRKKSEEEFNRLAMSRLMQPRPLRTSARAAAAAIRTVESGAGRLTMVTHPPGASSPIVIEPPEAGFLMEASATLAELSLRYQPPAQPNLGPLCIPTVSLPWSSSLAALEEMVRGLRPARRGARPLAGLFSSPDPRAGRYAVPPGAPPENRLPAAAPVWPPSLGIVFAVAGLEELPAAPSRSGASAMGVVSTKPVAGPPVLPAAQPVAHRPIPSRRCALTLPDLRRFTLGEDRRISTPSLTAPRLRIHLPKPTLQPYRPRFTFAPRDASPPAAPPPTAKRNPEREERRTKESNRQRRAREAAQAAAARTDPKPDSVLRKTEPKEEMPPPARETAPPGPTAPACQTNREASPSAEPDSAWNPEANREVASRSEAKPERSVARKREPVADFAPTFGGKAAGEPEGFLARLPGWQKAAAALVAVTIAAGAWTYPALQRGERRVSTTAAAVLAPENWETVAAGDAPRQRTIRRYKLAAGKKDYIFEFSGQIDQRAMGWVFRMKDARNYYCWKLERTGEGTSSSSQLVKFAVVDGQEQPHRLSVLREALVPGLPVNVRIEVRGQNFSVEINGKPADTWSDNQLAEGTVGFSNEDGERAAIRSAKVTL